MAVKLSAFMNDAQFSSNGLLLSGGKIETYLAGSSTPATTYTSSAGNVAQANPIILNTRGEVDNLIWLTTGIAYKFILKDSLNNVIRTLDNVTGVNDNVGTADQWVTGAVVPTFVAATQFTLAGDQTSTFEIGRRLKLTVTAGTVYGTIVASVFTTLTTITLAMDAGQVLDSGLSVVSYGIISTSNSSLPTLANSSTTAGTSTAFTLATSPAFAALISGTPFNVKFHVTAGTAPTLAVSGLAATALKVYNGAGAKIAATPDHLIAGVTYSLVYDGTDYVLLNPTTGTVVLSQVLAASALSLTTATSSQIASLSLTAGDWDITGNVGFISASASFVNISGWIDTSATFSGDFETAARITYIPSTVINTPTNGVPKFSLGTRRFSITATTTISLYAQASFTASTATAFGFISARRVR